jgi:hypothetical protein
MQKWYELEATIENLVLNDSSDALYGVIIAQECTLHNHYMPLLVTEESLLFIYLQCGVSMCHKKSSFFFGCFHIINWLR